MVEGEAAKEVEKEEGEGENKVVLRAPSSSISVNKKIRNIFFAIIFDQICNSSSSLHILFHFVFPSLPPLISLHFNNFISFHPLHSFSHQIHIVVDPLTLAGQRSAGLISLIRTHLRLPLTLVLTPLPIVSDYPLQNFYRNVLLSSDSIRCVIRLTLCLFIFLFCVLFKSLVYDLICFLL